MAATLDGEFDLLVLGASNAVGRFCLEQAAARPGLKLLAVSRRPAPLSDPGLTWLQQDLNEQPVWLAARALLSFGPVQLACRQLECMPSVGHVIALSSASTLFKMQSADPAERAQMAAIQADEARLASLCAARQLPLTLFKTTLIYGGGDDANVSRLAGLSARLPVLPLGGNGLRQPVHAEDLAALSLRALDMGQAASGTWILGGGEILDYRTLLRRIAAAQGRARRVVRLPLPLLKAGLRIAHILGRLRDVRPVMLERQAIDLTVDDQPARKQLGWNPRPFHP